MTRFLYIVTRDQPELYQQLYEHLTRDLEIATVELALDRRHAERRQQAERGEVERRQGGRRQHDVGEELVLHGWARVQIE
jgi:hypothetical protein